MRDIRIIAGFGFDGQSEAQDDDEKALQRGGERRKRARDSEERDRKNNLSHQTCVSLVSSGQRIPPRGIAMQ